MKRRVQGLRDLASSAPNDAPDGVYLVRVDRAQFHWHVRKPFYTLRLTVLEPRELAGRVESPLEAWLVPPRLPLRPRTVVP